MARILVVDDEAGARRSTRRYLEHQGWSVETVEGGTGARRVTRDESEPFDLLIADVMLLGEPSGLDLGERLYREGWVRKVLFVSAYVDVDLDAVRVPDPDKAFLRKFDGLPEISRTASELIAAAARTADFTRLWTDRGGRTWRLVFQPEVWQEPHPHAVIWWARAAGRIRFEGEDGTVFAFTPERLKPLSAYPSTELQTIVDEHSDPGGTRTE